MFVCSACSILLPSGLSEIFRAYQERLHCGFAVPSCLSRSSLLLSVIAPDWDEAQAYIDIIEELWAAARFEVAEEMATWPPSLSSNSKLLKQHQENERERCKPPRRDEQDAMSPLDDDVDDDAASSDGEEYAAAKHDWNSEEEQRDRKREPNALRAVRMTLDKLAQVQHQPREEGSKSIERQEEPEPEPEPEAPVGWMAYNIGRRRPHGT
ncbi:hypothetical protein CERZMDRAFT_101287 [Cercospora zeae-maydis SCOH1-5]|uniref:Uncharacterized protein n=1 Tax=Cercospora zeae-maydis SCOH1-5 TaxID=717836 RepID=A0A6A6F7T5_9PEZI|nr:hypothetical protein CERZMDRAFT_101287 [Cercospora zeae-maydis SCOH1-5]